MKDKGTANDMTGAIASSTEGTVRPDRALVAVRPWDAPLLNMHVWEIIFLFSSPAIHISLSVVIF